MNEVIYIDDRGVLIVCAIARAGENSQVIAAALRLSLGKTVLVEKMRDFLAGGDLERAAYEYFVNLN